MAGRIRPRKRYGQHFLVDRTVIERLTGCLDIVSGDRILEIGPGEGALTEQLIRKPVESVWAVEIDHRLCDSLRRRFAGEDRFRLICGDILKIDWAAFFHQTPPFRVVGNLPYNITSPVLFRLLDHRSRISDVTVMVQKEVADRLCSGPGSRAYGIPSVLFQQWSAIESVMAVHRGAFRPVPSVESVVIRIRFHREPRAVIRDSEIFRKVVRTAFGQRRKMLKNTLRPLFPEKTDPQSLALELNRRPESLSVEEFARISNVLADLMERRAYGRTETDAGTNP